jgi:hypothetical protein
VGVNRIVDGLKYLAEHISVTAPEFHRDNHPGGAMLLEGLVSHGYTNQRGDRFALSRAGETALKAHEQPEEEGA